MYKLFVGALWWEFEHVKYFPSKLLPFTRKKSARHVFSILGCKIQLVFHPANAAGELVGCFGYYRVEKSLWASSHTFQTQRPTFRTTRETYFSENGHHGSGWTKQPPWWGFLMEVSLPKSGDGVQLMIRPFEVSSDPLTLVRCCIYRGVFLPGFKGIFHQPLEGSRNKSIRISWFMSRVQRCCCKKPAAPDRMI